MVSTRLASRARIHQALKNARAAGSRPAGALMPGKADWVARHGASRTTPTLVLFDTTALWQAQPSILGQRGGPHGGSRP
jgi:hypothetical protein